MDLKNFQMMNVLLRVFDDSQVQGSEKSLTVLSNQTVELIESSPIAVDGFAKKDKLVYSPSNKLLSQQSDDLKLCPVRTFCFDSVLVNEYLAPDILKSAILVSIGKSDTLTNPNGLIFQSILAAFADSWTVQITCGYINLGKFYYYIDNLTLTCGKDAEKVFNCEYFSSDKLRENLVITTLILEKDLSRRVLNFFDVSQIGKFSDLFLNIFCSGGTIEKIPGDDIIYEILGTTFGYSPKITVIGNINPLLPFATQTRTIVLSLDTLNKKRKNINKAFPRLLLQELRNCNFKIFELEKTNEQQKRTIENLKHEQKKADIENSTLKEKLIKFHKDEEMAKMMNQIALFQENYLIKLAEVAELEEKLKELSHLKDMGRNVLEKKSSILGGSLAMELDFGKNKVSQDFATSPIRSLTLTEKSAIDRIEQLTIELDITKKKLKVLNEKEELLQFQIPPGTIEHHTYHEIITALYRLLEAMKNHYNDLFHQLQLRYNLQISVYENRDQFLRKKLSFSQSTHFEKLKDLQDKENELNLKENSFIEITEKYKNLKDEYENFKAEVIQYKKSCQEKLVKAKADINIRKELENNEQEIQDLNVEIKFLKDEMEKNNFEALKDRNQEIAKVRKKYEEQIGELNKSIGALKAMALGGKN